MYSITETELFVVFRRILDSFSDTSHSSTINLTHELLSQTLEEKSNIYVRPSIILYISPIENKIFHFHRDH